MRKFLILGGMLLLTGSAVMAQSYVESALLFGRSRPGGSARVQAMGGSQIALGGDYSVGLSNPAGLGMFNRSEFTITPGYSTYKTSASYLGNQDNETQSNIIIPGLSLVIHTPYERGGFVGGTFGISYTRTNDFNRSTFYHGKNDDSSIIDYFIDNAFGATTDQFDDYQYNTPTGLAYYNYLIGPESVKGEGGPNDEYFSDVTGFPNVQQEDIQVTGSTNQWSFAYGANYKDILFFGASIGVTSLRYKSTKVFYESFSGDPVFNNLQLEEYLQLKGSGLNATLGVTARPLDFLQVGVAYSTPTYYDMTETYNAGMSTSWKNFDYYGDGETVLNNESAQTDYVTLDYSLTTPGRLSAGVALLSKFGILTGDIEFTNPAKAKYSSDTQGVPFTQENQDIRSIYKATVNYRVGAEFRYKIFRARAGYGVQGSTYDDRFDLDNSITTISGGLGVKMKKVSVDFALLNSSGNLYYRPYTFFDGTGPTVNIDNKTLTGMITVGFSF